MQEPDSLYRKVIALFRLHTWMKDGVIVIGGVAMMLRLKHAEDRNEVSPFRQTIDLDIAVKTGVDIEKLKEALGDLRHDLFVIDPVQKTAGPLSQETTEIVLRDFDMLTFEGVDIPVVGPVGLLLSKLERSGEKGREYARGKDLLDVIHVWLAESKTVRERIAAMKDIPAVIKAVDQFRQLMRDEYSAGTRAVAEEMDVQVGDMDFIILRMRLDELFSNLLH